MKKKIVNVLITLALVSVCVIMVFCFYVQKLAICYSWNLNEYLTIVEYHDGRLGIKNNATGKIVGRFDQVLSPSSESDAGSVVVVKDYLRGYVSATTGEVIFEPQFRYAWIDDSDSHLAACVNQDYKLGFVNIETRETAIPFKYDFNDYIFVPYGEPVLDFVFCNGLCIVPDENGNLGLIDESGSLVLPIQYADIINWRDSETSEIILKRKAVFGKIANLCEDVNLTVDAVLSEDNYVMEGIESDDEYLYGVCDRSFNMLVPVEFNTFEKVWDYDNDGNIRICGYIISKDGRYGMLDAAFNEVLPLEYDCIESADHAYIASLKGKYGVLDEQLKTIVPFIYERIDEDYSGGDENGFVAVMDYIPVLFDRIGNLINDFYVPYEYVYDSESAVYVERIGIEAVSEPFNGGASAYLKYYLDDYCGVVTGTKRVVVPAKYDKIEYLGHGNFACVLNGSTYLIHDNK